MAKPIKPSPPLSQLGAAKPAAGPHPHKNLGGYLHPKKGGK